MKNNTETKPIVYIKDNSSGRCAFRFIPNKKLPENMPISTPINFVFLGAELILCLDKNDIWNPVCGKIEGKESWEEAVARETKEEIGVEVGDLHLVGYVEANNEKGSFFKGKTILPVVYSFAINIDKEWRCRETKDRDFFSHSNAKELFASRDDNGHMTEIYSHVRELFKNEISYSYSFIPNKILDHIETTSAMVFCLDKDKQVCIVKDESESFFSLPGGGKHMGESALETAQRELLEESQVIGRNFKILGSIVVSFKLNNQLVSEVQQARYSCEIEKIESFIPNKNGFETDFRDFIPINELESKVKQLQNFTGKEVINHLRRELS